MTETGDNDTSKHKVAYAGRVSESTRNPHAAKPASSRRKKNLGTLCPEERVLEQWRQSAGEPVSDEAKIQFQVLARDNVHRLADVRIWAGRHNSSSEKVKDTGTIHLEFFFDGTPAAYADNQDIFTQAFEQMIEGQLQERRVIEFRQKMATRRRGARNRSAESRCDGEDGGEGGCSEAVGEDDSEWKEYLRRPVPATNLSVRSLREAGCCISFLVVQTSLSVQASEVLGQIAFQEHFPIDGKDQVLSKSEKPLPKWAHGLMVATVVMGVICVFACWQVMRQAFFPAPPP